MCDEDDEYIKACNDAEKVARSVTGLLIQTKQTIGKLSRLYSKLKAEKTDEEKAAFDEKESQMNQKFESVAKDMYTIVDGLTKTQDLEGLFFRLVSMQAVMGRVTHLHHEIERTIRLLQEKMSNDDDDTGTEVIQDHDEGEERND